MRHIWARRSCPAFDPGAVPLADLAEVVRAACGLTGEPPAWPAPPTRAVPSAGACYPLELYVAAAAVAGAEPGLYHYNVLDHALEVVRLGAFRSELRHLFLDQPRVADAAAVLLFAAVFRRTAARYGARGYRYVMFEAGHAAQNACLVAGSLGLGSLCLGGFHDARLNRFLGLDGVSEAALYGVAVGPPAG
jgi:SagB-type dehydrogenase family enzyme